MPSRYKYFLHAYRFFDGYWVGVAYRQAPDETLEPLVLPLEVMRYA